MATAIKEAKVTSLNTQSVSSTVDPREQLLSNIRGSQVVIPDLQTMISHWPQRTHPDVEKLDEFIQETITSISSGVHNTARLRKLKEMNLAAFVASWWPYAISYEALETLALLAIWLFAWDDETDSAELSTIVNDWDKGSMFRQRTADFIQQSLSRNPKSMRTETNPLITCAGPIGDALLKSCSDPLGQVGTFLKEVLFFIKMCGEEQRFQLAHRLPTVEEYTQYRSGTGAIRICLATIEYISRVHATLGMELSKSHRYAWGISLSQELLDDDDMRQIWRHTDLIIYVYAIHSRHNLQGADIIRTNDMLSMKKEVEQSQVDSLIPLLSLQLGSVQAAVNYAVEIVHSSVLRFEAAEKRILQRYSSMSEICEDIRKFIDGCKYAATANLNWRYVAVDLL
ncbi:hypothetical protein Daesc_007478 [Daldinia eschscholtzii]|uniref:Terpene synthase n=1 Tax=Daldinia eschscholtzii TaxID=292717 RepID=A0AAX6ME61_9PEZI